MLSMVIMLLLCLILHRSHRESHSTSNDSIISLLQSGYRHIVKGIASRHSSYPDFRQIQDCSSLDSFNLLLRVLFISFTLYGFLFLELVFQYLPFPFLSSSPFVLFELTMRGFIMKHCGSVWSCSPALWCHLPHSFLILPSTSISV